MAVLCMVALVAALSGMEIDRAPAIDVGTRNLGELRPYWLASAGLWAALTGLWVCLSRTARGRQPNRRTFLNEAGVVMLIAIAARMAVLVLHAPALSDDLNRYVLDGRHVAEGVNPYLHTPQEAALQAEDDGARAALASSVNNPEMHSIYLPASQWIFGAIAFVTPGVSDPVAQGRVFRLAFIAAELLAMLVVLVMLRGLGRSAWWLALYAWHPIAITEIAGSGHQDALGLLPLVVALALHARGARPWRWTAALAMAALVKPVVIPVAALLLRGRRAVTWLGCALVAAVICTAIAAPLWFTHDAEPLRNLMDTGQRFSLKWAHFGSVYEPVLWSIERATNDPEEAWRQPDADLWTNDDQERLARGICLAMLAGVVVLAFLSRLDACSATRVVLVAMVLFSSTAHPWYLLWALVLAPLANSPALWTLSLTLPWGYAVLGDVVEWTIPPWVMWAVYVPVYAVLAGDLRRSSKADRTQHTAPIRKTP